MKYYNIESVGGIEFVETGDELLNVDGGDDTRLARYDDDKSIQSSGVSLDDLNNMTGINDLSVGGDLFIDGTAFIVHSGEVSTSDTIIYINYGEIGAGVTAGQAGIQVDRGTLTDYQFLFVEADDNFQIGEIGSLQPVATREAAPGDNFVPYWNDSEKRFDTTGSLLLTNVGDLTVAKEWTAQQNFNEAVITSSSNAVAWNLDAAQCAVHTMTENTTISAPTNMNAGGTYVLRIIQGAGVYTLAWNAVFIWGQLLASAEPVANGDFILVSFYSDGTNMLAVEVMREEA